VPRIEDYALLGDLQTAALASREGSVDWCCFSRFDSGACFAALLGRPEHGRWLLAPALPVRRASRRYRHDTRSIVQSASTTSSDGRDRSSAGVRSGTRSAPRYSLEPGARRSRRSLSRSGSVELDASVLLMPLVGFLPATDERFVKTVERSVVS
jgi:GH15 family glucan-1,4-alpha-glucosidase